MSKPVNVPLLDLKIQYAALRKEIEPAVLAAMEQAAYIMGPDIAALEKEVAAYLNCKHAIGCANGSDALVLALMALGIKPGDEVTIMLPHPPPPQLLGLAAHQRHRHAVVLGKAARARQVVGGRDQQRRHKSMPPHDALRVA